MSCKKKDLIEIKIMISLLSIKYIMMLVIISFLGWDIFFQELRESSKLVTVGYLLFALTPLILLVIYKLIYKKIKNDKYKKFNS